MADTDNSIAFWTQVATDYKTYPNVIFDLFNEPHLDNFLDPATTSVFPYGVNPSLGHPNPGTSLPTGLNPEAAWSWVTLRDGRPEH
jgi:hypothetical protein